MLQIHDGNGGKARPGSGTELEPRPRDGDSKTVSDGPPLGSISMPPSYQKFSSQIELGHYLTAQYHIRTPNELSSCEVCHR